MFGDQPFWARRVAALGAGPRPLPQKRLTASALASAIDETRRAAMIAKAGEVGAALAAEDGAAGAAALLDDGFDTRSPGQPASLAGGAE